jgi:hypothetical protein
MRLLNGRTIASSSQSALMAPANSESGHCQVQALHHAEERSTDYNTSSRSPASPRQEKAHARPWRLRVVTPCVAVRRAKHVADVGGNAPGDGVGRQLASGQPVMNSPYRSVYSFSYCLASARAASLSSETARL